MHIHLCGVLHNNLKANNFIFKEQENRSVNPVIIDFHKARFASDEKHKVAVTTSKREEYQKHSLILCTKLCVELGCKAVNQTYFHLEESPLLYWICYPQQLGRKGKKRKRDNTVPGHVPLLTGIERSRKRNETNKD